jgi:hypothetical protein
VNDKKLSVPSLGNPKTHQAHSREVLWQIAIPILIGLIVVLGLAVAVTFGSAGSVDHWGEISMVWLILPLFFFALIFLVILAGLIYATTYLLGFLPPYTLLVQDMFGKLNSKVKSSADAVVEPVLRMHAFRAGWRALQRKD